MELQMEMKNLVLPLQYQKYIQCMQALAFI